MKLPSFRLRIALFSTALAATALIGFGAISWFQIYNAKVNRLDTQIINHLMRAVPPPGREPPQFYQKESWEMYQEILSRILGGNAEAKIALLVLNAEDNRLYQSQEVIIDKDLHSLLVNKLALKVKGDRDLLMQVLQNLFSNAIKYNLADGWIKVDAKQIKNTLQVPIVNASEDIKIGDRALIFDRFHRGDPARTRKIEGIGVESRS